LLGVGLGTTGTHEGASKPQARDVSVWKGVAISIYQSPTLTEAGSFEKVTGPAVLGTA
jgi:hypothetical protein